MLNYTIAPTEKRKLEKAQITDCNLINLSIQ